MLSKITFKTLEKLFKGFDSPYEFKRAFCGNCIGKGTNRHVFIFNENEDYVVKIEFKNANRVFANVREYSNWQNVVMWEQMSEWLAPCIWISKCGKMMVQRRAIRQIDGDKRKYPDKIPSLLTDLKRWNFGWIDNQFVCFDYSTFLYTDFKFKKAKFK